MSSLKEMWRNGSRRLLIALIVISGFILLTVAGVAVSIFFLDERIKNVSANQKEISSQVTANTESIEKYQKAVNEGWQAYQKQNPTQPIPQIEQSEPVNGKTEVVIKPAISRPKPTATPKTKTVIRYKSRPTPAPFRLFGNPRK